MKTHVLRLVAVLLLGIITVANLQAQFIEGFSIEPSAPTTAAFVKITVYGV